MAAIGILLVDDDLDYAQIVSERLGFRGFEVDTARGALEAITALKYHDYQVVILDMMMPVLGGMDALKRIKDEHPEVRVILQTGHATRELKEQAAGRGALALLEKPVDLDLLDETIRKACGKE